MNVLKEKIWDIVVAVFLFVMLMVILPGCSTINKTAAVEREDKFHSTMEAVFNELTWGRE